MACEPGKAQGGELLPERCLEEMWEVAGTVAWGTDQSGSWQETDNLSHLRRV